MYPVCPQDKIGDRSADACTVLDGHSTLPLRLTSKRLSKVASDNKLWRHFCLESSHSEILRRHLDFLSGAPVTAQEPILLQLRAVAHLRTEQGHDNGHSSIDNDSSSTILDEDVHTGWGNHRTPPHQEQVGWYGEYIARHAPLSVSWLSPLSEGARSPGKLSGDARGLGCFGDHGERIVAPFGDGTVCIWDIGHDTDVHVDRNGRIMAHSKPGLLCASDPQWPSVPQLALNRYHFTSDGPVECVSVDAHRNKAYFAVQHGLNEVDLETLQLTSHHRYPAPISVLSKVDYPTPLTVGTTLSLHLHDPRRPGNRFSSAASERLDPIAMIPSLGDNRKYDLHRLLSGDHPVLASATHQPYPLSIVHPPSSNAMHVAGRFPSILAYDRRTFPKIESTIHSSASLCSLAVSPSPNANDLVACGEYKSKGSLEIHRIPHSSESHAPQSNIINRTSASRSKLLSVATHGTRLVFSDGDGMLKWVEKDGSTLVRRWNINQFSERESPRGVFGGVDDGDDDVVRKILPLHEDSRSELAIWTGEKIGIVGFRKNPRFGPWEGEGADDDEEGKEEREMEGLYGERMRMALERQADEVRFTRWLGFGI